MLNYDLYLSHITFTYVCAHKLKHKFCGPLLNTMLSVTHLFRLRLSVALTIYGTKEYSMFIYAGQPYLHLRNIENILTKYIMI